MIDRKHAIKYQLFFIPKGNGFYIRWLTPASEVDLCGHETLAAAYVLVNIIGYKRYKVEFGSKFGILAVTIDKFRLFKYSFLK